jgi:hypothetical protein
VFGYHICGNGKVPHIVMDSISRSKRFSDTNGWGYAVFKYDAASDAFSPDGKDAKCGAACHKLAAAKDYIFTAYLKR